MLLIGGVPGSLLTLAVGALAYAVSAWGHGDSRVAIAAMVAGMCLVGVALLLLRGAS